MTTIEKRTLAIDSGLVLSMILFILIPVAWWVVDHGNANQDRQQAQLRREQDQQQAQYRRQLEAKFQQALRISSRQSAYSINKSVCVLRKIAKAQIARLELTKSKGYKSAEGFWQQILEGQVPVPPSFDCRNLPEKVPLP